MKNTILICIAIALAGCGGRKYESATVIVQRFYSHERFENSTLRWTLHEVLGPKGPYILSESMPHQSNPGQAVTFHVLNGVAGVSERYTPDTGQAFFLCVPVVNREGLNAAIILKTVEEHNKSDAGDG
ncbi:MAG: hypothetical protein QGH94_03750 [Phycisphaerae bacterium]|nr:hypothetical protein [Phycisphaerae bacterium]